MQRAAWILSAVSATLLLVGSCGVAPPNNGDDPAAATLFAEDNQAATSALDFAPDELILRTLPGAPDNEVTAALDRADVDLLEALPEIETLIVGVAPERLIDAAESLAAEAVTEAVQKNYYFDAQRAPDDPRFADQQPLTIVGLPDAWDITVGTSDLITAVLDTGVDTAHADLVGRVLSGRNTFERNTDTDDVFGHGTLVAGVIGAASDNGTGVAGVNWSGELLAVRVTNASGRASSSAIASGIVWATHRGARVINISFAPLQADTTVLRAARYAYANGGLVFISAGNDGQQGSARGAREAVFVGATEDSDALAAFSSTGPYVDLAAPGVAVWSTANTGDYKAVTGTSFASPIVAGVAGLIWSIRPELRPVTVERILRDTSLDLGEPGRDDRYGAGRLDAAAAVAAARDIIEADDKRAPLVTILAPANGAQVSGVVRVAADAADLDDGEGVADVVLYVDGEAVATDTAAPYRFALSTARLAPGIHAVTCVATDVAGNASQPAEVQVRVGTATTDAGGPTGSDAIPPTVTIQFPIDGATVSGQVGARAQVADNQALRSVEWLIDGASRRTDVVNGTQASASYVWDATGASAGAHVITVRVYDTDGNSASASVSLTKQ